MLLQSFFSKFFKNIYMSEDNNKIIMAAFTWAQSLSQKVHLLFFRCGIFIWYRAEICLHKQITVVTEIVHFYVISSQDYILLFFKKLKLHIKLGPEKYIKYSHQNLFVMIGRLPSPKKQCSWKYSWKFPW